MKKSLALLLAILMVLSLTACSKDDTVSDDNTSSNLTTTESDVEDVTENKTESDATESTATDSSSETSTPSSSSSKPTESSKPTTSTTTPSTTTKPTETKCTHNIKYTFDGIANTWSHTGQCTLCKGYFNNNIACADKNKDNKCDICSAKMDFGTAYQNVGFIISWTGLNYSDKRYDENPVLTAETVFMETRYKTKETDVKFNYSSETYIYSATDFEKMAKSLFNIDDAKIAEMRTLQQKRDGTMVNVYDSVSNTYSYEQGAFGGGGSPDYLGYKKISDTEYAVYINDTSYDYVKVINCTYTDTVKISSIYAISTAPSGLIKFKYEN